MNHQFARRAAAVMLLVTLLFASHTPTAADGAVPITAANASTVTELARLGRGTANCLAWSPDGQTLAVGGSLGIWLYHADDLQAAPRLLTGHTDVITQLAYSRDGRRLASLSRDQTIRVWDTQTGEQHTLLQGFSADLTSFALSPDGALLASGDAKGNVTLWDIPAGTQRTVWFISDQSISSLVFSPDGAALAVGGWQGLVQLWDIKINRSTLTLKGHNLKVTALLYNQDGTLLISGSDDPSIRLWNAQTGALLGTLTDHMSEVQSLALSQDGQTLAANTADSRIWLWDMQTLSPRRVLRSTNEYYFYPNGTAYSPTSNTLAAAAYDGQILLWNTDNGQVRADLRAHSIPDRVLFNGNGKTLLTDNNDGYLYLWDVPSAMQHAREQNGFYVYTAYSTDRSLIASGGSSRDNAEISIIETQTGRVRTHITWKTLMAGGIRFSADDALIATLGNSNHVYLLDTVTGKLHGDLVPTFPRNAVNIRLDNLAFSPRGTILAVWGGQYKKGGSDWTPILYYYDIATEKWQEPLDLGLSSVESAVFSPDGGQLYILTLDGKLQTRDLTTGEIGVLAQLDPTGRAEMRLSPDGKAIVVLPLQANSLNEVTLLDAQTGDIRRAAIMTSDRTLPSARFSPDSTVLAVTDQKTIQLWDVTTGQLLTVLEGHNDSIYDLDFSANGTLLASASADGTTRLWGIKPASQFIRAFTTN